MEGTMDASDTEELDNLADPELVERLRCVDWTDRAFVKDERLVELFRSARATGNTARVGLFTDAISRRLLQRSRGFVAKNNLAPAHFSSNEEGAHELAWYVWDRLLKDNNAAFAARRFGFFFQRQSISFFRALMAQCRTKMVGLEDWHHAGEHGGGAGGAIDEGDEGGEKDGDGDDDDSPDRVLERKRVFAQLHARLHILLTPNEYSVFVMLWRKQMKVKDIATALGVDPRTINNYQRSIKAKVKKEFNHDFA